MKLARCPTLRAVSSFLFAPINLVQYGSFTGTESCQPASGEKCQRTRGDTEWMHADAAPRAGSVRDWVACVYRVGCGEPLLRTE